VHQILKTAVVAVVGAKKSGKTTTIELLTKELTRRGYRVAVAKHISEPDFSIDKEGKDTWRYARAGARTVIAVSSGEIDTIEKVETRNLSLDAILSKCRGLDVVFLEGFTGLVAKDRNVNKIVVAKSALDIVEAVKSFEPIMVFTGPFPPEGTISPAEIPYVDVLKNQRLVADMVEKVIKK
jgi:molybdopterin-guanine dinucleotide biosynthesis protein MobB